MKKLPNVIYIYADDLGRGLLSCYGQKLFQTPNIDRLASQGMRFCQAYGSALCAPARASLLCGIHDARPGAWSYSNGSQMMRLEEGTPFEEICESLNSTGMETDNREVYLPSLMKQAGYRTVEVGKLEWGFTATPQELERHGWDHHFGYYDHDRCHGYYPPYLFRDGKRVDIPGNTWPDCGRGEYEYAKQPPARKDMEGRAIYSQDLFDEEILGWIRRQPKEDAPLFLYHPTQLPHGPVFYPKIYPQLEGLDILTQVEKEFASMVLRLDETVGKIMDALDETGMAQNTLLIFSSDNGHGVPYRQAGRTFLQVDRMGNRIDDLDVAARSHTIGDVFDGNDGQAGIKCSNWNGGASIPMLVRFPGVTEPGSLSNELVAAYDWMATMADLLGISLDKKQTDGVSMMPALRGKRMPSERHCVVYGSPIGPSLVTRDGWKLRVVLDRCRVLDYREFDADASTIRNAYHVRLYDLNEDYGEEHNLSCQRPDKCSELMALLLRHIGGNLVNGLTQTHYRFSDYGWVK